MITITKISELTDIVATKLVNKKVGFVPTMGHLHVGHKSLIAKAKAQNDIVVVSIFINPTQFNNNGDYQNYPKSIAADKDILQALTVDYLFMPCSKDLYPNDYAMSVTPKCVDAETLEGKCRPGHFAGMLTIVLKLLLLVKPQNAYFGEKDYQQLNLVKTLQKSFFLATNIIAVPTKRLPSGVPYSSRNNRLSNVDKIKLNDIYAAMKKLGLGNIAAIKDMLMRYVSLEYLEKVNGRIFLAMDFNGVRLIDNFLEGDF